MADQIETALGREILDRWFPACLRERGFHQDFDRAWNPAPSSGRFLVFQSRLTWVAATVAEAYPDRRERFADYADHGLRFLIDTLWDRESGAFRWWVGPQGGPISEGEQRHAYGISFAIYALAAAARALGSEEAYVVAQSAFRYLEERHHDATYRGYFEQTDSVGRVIERPLYDGIGTPPGLKSQNTHLHLLESFTELYRIWPDPLLAERLDEVLSLFTNELYEEPGFLHAHAHRDWLPVHGQISFGHDIEAAHLALDAATALGRAGDPKVLSVAETLVDDALRRGWDEAGGGFLYGSHPLDARKNWWVQAEGLLALARLGRHEELAQQWAWIRDRQIDPEFGGLFADLSLDGDLVGSDAKGSPWKDAYHEARGLLFTAQALRRETV